MKNCRQVILCLVVSFCFAMLCPVQQVQAKIPMAAEIAEMESDIESMEIEVSITEPKVGWRYVPKINFYPASSTGLKTDEPISGSNRVSKEKNSDYYMTGVRWYSSDETVLSLSKHASGYISIAAESEGTAVLTARLGNKTTSLTFVVSGAGFLNIAEVEAFPYDEVTDEAVSKDTLTVTQGDTFEIPSKIYIEGTPNPNGSPSYMTGYSDSMQYGDLFEWKSSDESVVNLKYAHSGEFKALKPGIAVVTVTAGGHTDSVTVTVKNNPQKAWCSPVEADRDKISYGEKYGKTIHTKKELYQYVYDNLSIGNYELAVIYPEEYLDFDLQEEFKHAVDLYEEYIVIDERCDANDESPGAISTIYLSGAREGIHYFLCQQNSRQMVARMTKKADQVLSQIISDNMTDKQKLRAIHDYIVKNCDYDVGNALSITYKGKKYVNKNPSGTNCSTAYGALIEKKAVCEGYSHLFNLLSRRAGIPSVMVAGSTEAGLHAWNLVKIHGKYRYIDTTWDDPVHMDKFNPKKPFAIIKNKKVYSNYFLVTDKKLKKDHRFVYKNHVSQYNQDYQYTIKK